MRAPAEITVPAGPEPAPRDVLVRCVAAGRTFRRGTAVVHAVRDVHCAVPAGLRAALVGPSGSGKSTLLHLLAALDRPTAGTIERPGLRGTAAGEEGGIGVVFQGPSLVPALDVLENVALPLLLAGVAERVAVERAAAALDRLDLGFLAGALPETLSGGQAQRVAAARVLAGRPALVLADEPTGQLDRATADHVLEVLLDAADELGAALVVSTHDEVVAGRLATRWTMADGRLDTGRAT